MTYDKEFEEWYKKDARYYGDIQACMYAAWQAARKDHYRIGEEVESLDGTKKAKVCAAVECGRMYDLGADNVRRIPAKTRIDEIAEEAEDKYRRGAVGAGSLTDIIKSAILQARKEWEANR